MDFFRAPKKPDLNFYPAFRAGFLAGSPLLLGLLPFAVIYGASAKAAGLSPLETIGMSLCVFAGSAQLVFVELWQNGLNLLALILTCLTVNLRLLIYSASIAPHLGQPNSLLSGLVRSYFLTDESYATSMSRFAQESFKYPKLPFFLGSAMPTWLCWQSVGLISYLTGSLIPEKLPLKLAIPLVFLALLVSSLRASAIRRQPKIWAALAGGLSALALKNLPLNLGLIFAIIIGVSSGLLAEKILAGRGTN